MKKNALEIFKTAAVCVLLVSLVCLCTVYLFSFENSRSPEFTASMLESIRARASKNMYSEEFSPSLVTPYFIGVGLDGTNRGVFNDYSYHSVSSLYLQISEFFPPLFVSGNTRQLSESAGKQRFNDALSKDHIYVSFVSELPKSLIYDMTFPQNVTDDVTDEYISELVIFPTGNPTRITDTDIYGNPLTIELFAFSAVGRNSAGEYYLYTSDVVPEKLSDVYFGKSKLSSYNMTGAVSFEFAANTADYADSFLTGTTIVTGELTAVGIDLAFPLAAISDSTANAVNAFGLKYEKAARYMDYDGSISYLEEGHNVRITRDGKLYYNTTGNAGGVMMSDLGITAETSYSINDYAFAALKLIDAAENDGGALSLKLTGIYADGDNVVVTLGYSCMNLSVISGGTADVIRFEFNSGKLIKAEMTLLSATAGKKYEYVYQAWEAALFNALSDKTCDFRPVYSADESENPVYAGWKAFAAGEEAER